MRRLRPESLAFTLLLGALGTLPPFAIDMALPALSEIGASLQASVGTVTLTLSVFLAGFSLAQLAFGPLSDRFGRKPALLTGCALFAVASFACAAAPNIEILLLARFVEGCGAGAGMVMVFAMVRDLFPGIAGRTKLSYVTLVINIAPMIAPTVGAWILAAAHWRAIYAALGVGGTVLTTVIWLGLAEPLKMLDRNALRLKRACANYLRVVRNRAACGFILVNGLGFGCMFAYVAGSAFAMMEVLGLSAQAYGLSFAATALGILVGSFVSGQLSRCHVPARVPLLAGLTIAFASAVVLLAATLGSAMHLGLILPLLVLNTFAYGLIAPTAAHGALQPLPEIAGVAGATLGFVQMAGGSLASALVARFSDGATILSMTGTMTLCAGFALLLYLAWIAPVERRLTPGAAME